MRNIWPNNHQAAAMVTVELDAEFIWLDMDPNAIHAPKVLSNGEFGFMRGYDRLLEALERHGIKATFFVLGAVADKYPDEVLKAVRAGHEIACHGYYHNDYACLSYEEQKEDLEKGLNALEKLISYRPRGFRAPEGELNCQFFKLIQEEGLLYDSSLLGNDVPHFMPIYETKPSTFNAIYPEPFNGKPSNVIEIPMHWELQDFPYFTYNRRPAMPQGQQSISGYKQVLYNWLWELDAFYDMGLCYVCKFDPQTIGHGGRMLVLEELLTTLTAKNIWIATGTEIAEYYKSNSDKIH